MQLSVFDRIDFVYLYYNSKIITVQKHEVSTKIFLPIFFRRHVVKLFHKLENVIVKFLTTLNYKLFVQQYTIFENTYNNMHNFFKYISDICNSNFDKVGCLKEKQWFLMANKL